MSIATDPVSSERRLPHPILALDEFGARSRCGRGLVELTSTEFALLHFLAYLPPGKVAAYAEIARALRPTEHALLGKQVVRGHANEIRRKVSGAAYFAPAGCVPWPWGVIVTRHGIGLRLDWSLGLVSPSDVSPQNAINKRSRRRRQCA